MVREQLGHADIVRLDRVDDMEYTTMPQIMKKLEGRWAKV